MMNRNERLNVCLGEGEKPACEFVVSSELHKKMKMERCGVCNCLLRVKASLSGADCPKGKWKK